MCKFQTHVQTCVQSCLFHANFKFQIVLKLFVAHAPTLCHQPLSFKGFLKTIAAPGKLQVRSTSSGSSSACRVFTMKKQKAFFVFHSFFFSNSGLHALPIENSQLNFSCTGSAQFWVETLQLTQFCIHDPCPSQSQPKLMFFDHALQASSQHPHQSCGCTGCAFWLNSAHCFLVFAVTQVFAHPIGVCVPLETM